MRSFPRVELMRLNFFFKFYLKYVIRASQIGT